MSSKDIRHLGLEAIPTRGWSKWFGVPTQVVVSLAAFHVLGSYFETNLSETCLIVVIVVVVQCWVHLGIESRVNLTFSWASPSTLVCGLGLLSPRKSLA